MQELILHIDYLLRHNDCVIVPGIGAFIASVRCASTGADGSVCPPARILVFNPNVNHNDGLLSASYARRMLCEASEASASLARDIEQLRATLESGAGVAVGDRGTMRMDAAGCIAFEASQTDSWLPVLQLQNVLDMARNDDENYRAGIAAKRGEHIAANLRRLKVAASIAVILVLGFVLSTPTPIENAQFASPVVEQFKPKMPQTESLMRQPGRQYGALQINRVADTAAVIHADTAAIATYKADLIRRAEELKQTAAARKNTQGRYCLVIASLNSGEEAHKFLTANSTMKLHVLENDGRYRVYALSGNTINDVKAQAAAEGLFERFPGAWVCRR